MPEDFHARSLLSVKSVKSPKTCRPTKLLVAREKKPPVPRVCNGMSFLRIGLGGGRINDKRGGEV